MVKRGALTVTDDPEVADEPATGQRQTGTGTAADDGPTRFAAPSSVGHVLRSEDFLGKVPVTLVFCPEGPDTDRLLQALDDVFPRFGEVRVQLLVVLGVDAAEIARRHDALGVHLPLLADPDGRLALDHGVTSAGAHVHAFVMDRDGRIVDELTADAATLEPGQLLALTIAAAEREPERFEPHHALRS
jgi:peroxiredoxin